MNIIKNNSYINSNNIDTKILNKVKIKHIGVGVIR